MDHLTGGEIRVLGHNLGELNDGQSLIGATRTSASFFKPST